MLLLASACSEVSLHPAGGLELTGPGAQFMHFHGLLKKVGVTFQELRMGRYKSALESYTRDEPSEPVLEEMHAILDDLYEDQVSALAENRGMKPLVVRGHIDQRMFSPADAKKAGLVDHVEFEDEFLARVRGAGDKAMKVVDSTTKKEVKIEGLTGLMTLFNELFGSPKKKAGSGKEKIALIYALGAISTGAEGQSLLSFGGMTSETMVKAIRKARADKTVRAVVLRVDSPGGSALASDFIWREIVLTREVKPVVVSMGNVAASGGYYIACPANWIVAESGTITGSIGVIGAITSMKGLYDKAGLKVTSITRGKRGDLIDGYGRISPEGRRLIMKEMQRIYDDSLTHVAKGRKLPKKAVASIAEVVAWVRWAGSVKIEGFARDFATLLRMNPRAFAELRVVERVHERALLLRVRAVAGHLGRRRVLRLHRLGCARYLQPEPLRAGAAACSAAPSEPRSCSGCL